MVAEVKVTPDPPGTEIPNENAPIAGDADGPVLVRVTSNALPVLPAAAFALPTATIRSARAGAAEAARTPATRRGSNRRRRLARAIMGARSRGSGVKAAAGSVVPSVPRNGTARPIR